MLANVIPLISKADLLSADEVSTLKAVHTPTITLPRLPLPELFRDEDRLETLAPYTVSSATGSDWETIDASLLMSPEYVQPLIPSELRFLVDQIFDLDVMKFLRHTASKKLISWYLKQSDRGLSRGSCADLSQRSPIISPIQSSTTGSGMIVPSGSPLALTASNSYALARVTDYTQREERLAQVRLSRWAIDLQTSLHRERERYEQIAKKERAMWLLERMGEEVRDGQVLPQDKSQYITRNGRPYLLPNSMAIPTHDPLGLLRWHDAVRTRGWIALQIIGGFSVIGGLACWLAKTCGFNNTLHEWMNDWYYGMNGLRMGDA